MRQHQVKFATAIWAKGPYHPRHAMAAYYQIPDASILMRPWGRRIVIWAAWTVPAVLFAVLSHARMVAIGEDSSIWVRLTDHLTSWYTWAALAPGIAWLDRA